VREEVFFAPVVRLKRSGRYAFLLPWRRDKEGRWEGHIAWLVREQVLWKGVDVWTRAQDLEQVEDQDYRRVPRTIDAYF
jgi:hypothetical protein